MADPDSGIAPPKAAKEIPFASTVKDLKEKIATINENKKMGADLLFTTTYMASLALANASRPELFAYAANRKEYISSKYLDRVDTYVKKWGYSYSESLSIVAEKVNNEIFTVHVTGGTGDNNRHLAPLGPRGEGAGAHNGPGHRLQPQPGRVFQLD